MINTIIFDFGDIFINLDKEAPIVEFSKLGLKEWTEDLDELNLSFEKGKISELQFIEGFQKHMPKASIDEIRNAWNTILLDFPLYRLEFLQMLSQKYRLFLLSNTDAIHIDRFQHKAGITFYREFYQCFERVYFSFELGMRKPEAEIFKYLVKQHELTPKRTLFIDDKKENTDAALALGFQVWNLQVGKEDVVHLFDKKII
ncbi:MULTISPECIES: HAD family hydrolase [Flavobacterium]|uniref:HAD family phosphatase n=1 Tax=Flavobacterium ranwuense TaxID=2541725 RepID=A0ABY2DTD7_9FLAO|nr:MULTISPECIES: HAD family phosphatase [Flavobacterium]TDE29866.1 HAD family phosphatase [Flavobacterium ranwuense]TDE54347.1 HAD family phosphatase [Flavobacterium sp. GT3P67]